MPEFDLTPVDHDPFAAATAPARAVGALGRMAAPNLTGLVSGEAAPPIANFPDTPGKVPSVSDPRFTNAIGEAANIGVNLVGPPMKAAAAAVPLVAGLARRVALPAAEEAANVGGKGIRAYHGSPHDFDRFDLSKIGTGEGNQAYGHGLYFAEKEGVARDYQKRLATANNVRIAPEIQQRDGPAWNALNEQIRAATKARDALYYRGETHAPNYQELDATVGKLNAQRDAMFDAGIKETIEKYPHLVKGRMYEVNINAKPEQFLDWDKPLRSQHPEIQDAAHRALGILEPTYIGQSENGRWLTMRDGETIGRSTGWPTQGDAEAAAKILTEDAQRTSSKTIGDLIYKQPPLMREDRSAKLLEHGIPGIRYLDQGSRTAGEGSRNYVLFRDDIIDVVKKYGLAGLAMLPPALAASISQQLTPVDHDPFAPSRARGGRVDPDNIHPAPSEAQKKAGNYSKDHVHIHGLDLTIENAKGSFRRGVDKGGKPWAVKMPSHYGYFKRTEGKDGDQVDCYLGQHVRSPRVFIVDQLNADTRQFDEHKCFLGFASKASAVATYHKAFSDGRSGERLGHVTEMNIEQFKDWLDNGNTTKPASAPVNRKARVAAILHKRGVAA